MVSPIVRRGIKKRTGRGFSQGEVKEAGLNVGEARHLGVPVDLNRRTCYEENIKILREWMEASKNDGFRLPKPKQSSKGQRGRVFRGLTSSGKRVRGKK